MSHTCTSSPFLLDCPRLPGCTKFSLVGVSAGCSLCQDALPPFVTQLFLGSVYPSGARGRPTDPHLCPLPSPTPQGTAESPLCISRAPLHPRTLRGLPSVLAGLPYVPGQCRVSPLYQQDSPTPQGTEGSPLCISKTGQ